MKKRRKPIDVEKWMKEHGLEVTPKKKVFGSTRNPQFDRYIEEPNR